MIRYVLSAYETDKKDDHGYKIYKYKFISIDDYLKKRLNDGDNKYLYDDYGGDYITKLNKDDKNEGDDK